jgi:hypothetical protein
MKRVPWLVPLLLATGMTTAGIAQRGDPERQAVLATIHRLFDGMRNGDSAAVRAAFHPSAYLATALQPPTGPVLRIDTLETFIRAVGSPRDQVWDERVGNEEVRMDGPLATVWTEYSFFAGTKFSHCGVDAFQLARTGEGWRIIALTDTRRREGCRDGGGG